MRTNPKPINKKLLAIGIAATLCGSMYYTQPSYAAAVKLGDGAWGNSIPIVTGGGTSIGIGDSTTRAQEINSIAIGAGSLAGMQNSIAMGTGAKTDIGDSGSMTANVAIGNGAIARSMAMDIPGQTIYYSSTALGNKAVANFEGTTAVGSQAEAQGTRGTAVGAGAYANKLSTAVGSESKVTGTQATAIGASAKANANDTVAVGFSAATNSIQSIAVGSKALANGSQSVAIGYNATTKKEEDTAIGFGAKTSSSDGTKGNTAIGAKALVEFINDEDGSNKASGTAVGLSSKALAGGAVALGEGSTANQQYTTALGSYAQATGAGAVALGGKSQATAKGAIAIGGTTSFVNASYLGAATATGESAIAIGNDSSAVGIESVAIGQGAFSFSRNGVAIGRSASANSFGSIAIGNALARAQNATAIGQGAMAEIGESVAIGAISQAESTTKVSEATVGNIRYTGFAGNDPRAGFSIGNKDTNTQRQMQNVAAGRISADSTDGINGSQLFATATVIGNVADSAKAILGGNTALGTDGTLSMSNIGGTGETTVHDAIKKVADSDALSVKYDSEAKDTVTLGGGADGTKITNVAAGTLSADSKDAVNGSQLYATNQQVAANTTNITNNTNSINTINSTLADGTFTVSANGGTTDRIAKDENIDFASGTNTTAAYDAANNKVTYSVVDAPTFAGTVTSNMGFSVTNGPSMTTAGIDAGSKVITNVANAQNAADAVNKGQLDAAITTATGASKLDITDGTTDSSVNLATQKLGIKGTADEIVSTVNGQDVTLSLSDTVKADIAKGKSSIQSVAVAAGETNLTATTDADKNVTLAFSKTPTFDKTTVGTVVTDSATNKISGLAEATLSDSSTEAVTGKQLYATNEKVAQNTTNIATNTTDITNLKASDALSVKYDSEAKDTVTLGGGADGTKITNVAAGTLSADSKDAVNGSQLYATNQQVAANTTNITNNTNSINTINSTLADGTFTVSANGGTTDRIAKDENIDFASGTNTTAAYDAANNKVTYSVVDAPTFAGTVTSNMGFSVTNGPSMTTAGIDAGSKVITNVANAQNAADAVNKGQLDAAITTATGASKLDITDGTTDSSVNLATQKLGIKGTADEIVSTVNGQDVTLSLSDTVKADIAKGKSSIQSVAVAAGETNLTATTDADKNVTLAFSKTPTFDKTTVGSVVTDSATNKISGLAEATLSDSSTEAVTGKQLYATNEKVAQNTTNIATNTTDITNLKAADALSVKYDSAAKDTVTLGGGADGTKITNVAAGTLSKDSKDAVNGSQLYATNQQVATNTTNITNNTKNITNIMNGAAGTMVYTKTDGTKVQKATDGKFYTELNTDGSGKGTAIENNNIVLSAVNADGTTTAPTKLSNVAAGTADNDAVNVKQLKESGLIDKDGNVQGLTFAGDSGTNVTRKLGETLTVKGGQTDTAKLSNDNIGVVTDTTDNSLNIKLAKDLKALTSAEYVGANGAKTVTNAGGITITPPTTAANQNPVSLTSNGLNNGGNEIKGVAAGTSNDAAVNKGQMDAALDGISTVAGSGKDGKDGSNGTDGASITGPTGKDGLNGKDLTDKTNAAGDRLVKANDGNYYLAADVNADGTLKGTPTAQTAQLSLVNANGETTAPTKLSNVAAGTADNDAVNVKQLKDSGLIDKDGNVQGLTFAGDSGTNVTRKLGETLTVKGGQTDTAKLSDDNIGVVTDTTDNSLNIKLAKDLKALTSAEYVGADGAKTVTNAGGITITPPTTAANQNPVSLTSNGLNNGGNEIKGVAAGTSNDAAVNKGQMDAALDGISTVAGSGKDGKDGSNGTDGASITGPTGKDGLNGKDLTDKTNALRNGEAGAIVYTNAAGDRLVKANDGNYYLAADVNADGTLKGTPTAQTAQLSLVNANGETTAPTKLSNVAAGTADNDAVNVKQLKDSGLIDKDGNVQGLTFAGDSGTNVTRKLGETLTVKGGQTDTAKLSDDNIGVVTDTTDNSLNIKLAKDLKALTSAEYVGANGAKTVTNAGGITITPPTTAANQNPVSLTSNGLNNGGNEIKGVAAGTSNDAAVNKGQMDAALKGISTVAGSGKDGKDGSDGNSGASITGPTGKDGLNGKDLTYKTNALRNGEAGAIVYTNAAGDRLVKANDGNYYLAADVNADGTLKGTPTAQTAQLSLVNANGETTAPTKLSNVAAGTADNDAVNVKQLKDSGLLDADGNKQGLTFAGNSGTAVKYLGETMTIKGGATGEASDSNIKTVVLADGSLDIQILNAPKFTGTVTSDAGFTVTGGTTIGKDKVVVGAGNNAVTIDGSTGKISNVTGGTIGADSKDAINGGQLYNVANSVKDVLGGKATLGTDGKLSMSDIGGTGKDNLNDAIKEAYDKAGEAGKVAGSGADGKDGVGGTSGATGATGQDGLNGKDLTEKVNAIRNGEAGTMVYTNKDGDRLVKGNDGKYYLAADVNADGTTKAGAAAQETKLSAVNSDGSTTAPTQIGNVADGVAKNDAVNKGQLDEVAAIAGKHTTVTAGDNIVVTENKNAEDGKNYTVSVNPNMKLESVTLGNNNNVVINDKGLTIKDGPSITQDGINGGGKVISNIGEGSIAAGSKDAVTGGQLYETNKAIGNIGNAMTGLRNDMEDGDAMNAALSALKPLQYDPMEPTQIMAGAGAYKGSYAASIGLAHYANEKNMYNMGVAFTGNGKLMFNVGATWKFGPRKAQQSIPERYRKGPLSSVYVMQAENSMLKDQVAKLQETTQSQAKELEVLKQQMKVLLQNYGK